MGSPSIKPAGHLWALPKDDLKIIIKKCHQKIVIKNCHKKLSSKFVINNCHQKLSSIIVKKNVVIACEDDLNFCNFFREFMTELLFIVAKICNIIFWIGNNPHPLDLPQYILIYLTLPQFTSIYLDLHQFILIYLNLP